MDERPDSTLAATLLTVGRTVVLELDEQLGICAVHNPLLLDEWREPAARAGRDRPTALKALFEELLPPMRARELWRRVGDPGVAAAPGGLYLGVIALLPPRGGAPDRHAAVSLHQDSAADARRMLMLRDVTAMTDVQQNLAETQSALDAAMAALRAPSRNLRMFLGSALTSISAIRAMLKLPARDHEALHDKLARLHAAVAQLGSDAEALKLAPVQNACQTLLTRLTGLLEREELAGDALLPLAILVDRIASTTGTLWRIEEQRHAEPQAARPRSRRQPDWTYASERRWSSFLHHRGEEIGVLVTLHMDGAVHVPTHLRVSIDELLQDMLRNAVEQGIETPEERLAAQKPAAGKVSVTFENLGNSLLRMTVRDDGRGRGLGLTALRKAVGRLGGEIAVAAKPGEYTQFVIDLPQASTPAQSAAVSQ